VQQTFIQPSSWSSRPCFGAQQWQVDDAGNQIHNLLLSGQLSKVHISQSLSLSKARDYSFYFWVVYHSDP
ncbi:MAG: hypothetical protein ACRC4N_01050, partial [Gammaproteobacteria bacterium]